MSVKVYLDGDADLLDLDGSSKNIAYWRVINTNGGLIARFPGGVAGQAALLGEEGFTIDTKGKVSKVKNFRENLVRFD